ncbi:nucleotidyltransferase domain-containing protein [Candidatus Pacearchaeota archaeon]|nr:nucleotidyltransferase domain-containing protein [Candidatus Pacearchaeota archaeon]
MTPEQLNTIIEIHFGSHLYRTNTPESDQDYKGVYIPIRREILLGTFEYFYKFDSKEDNTRKNTAGDTDRTFYAIHEFVAQCCKGTVWAIDMLHAPDENCIGLINDTPWHYLRERKKEFVTLELVSSFRDYSAGQLAKYGVKGSRINAAEEFLAWLLFHKDLKKVSEIEEPAPTSLHIQETDDRYNVCNKTFMKNSRIGQAIACLERFLKTYGERAICAREGRHIDWKAASHALRAQFQLLRLLQYPGCDLFPFKDEIIEDIKTVKCGNATWSHIEKVYDGQNYLIDKALENADLPVEVDRQKWELFLINVCDKLAR